VLVGGYSESSRSCAWSLYVAFDIWRRRSTPPRQRSDECFAYEGSREGERRAIAFTWSVKDVHGGLLTAGLSPPEDPATGCRLGPAEDLEEKSERSVRACRSLCASLVQEGGQRSRVAREVGDRCAIESAHFVALDIERPDHLPAADDRKDEFRSRVVVVCQVARVVVDVVAERRRPAWAVSRRSRAKVGNAGGPRPLQARSRQTSRSPCRYRHTGARCRGVSGQRPPARALCAWLASRQLRRCVAKPARFRSNLGS